jgi:hypothetical protein
LPLQGIPHGVFAQPTDALAEHATSSPLRDLQE